MLLLLFLPGSPAQGQADRAEPGGGVELVVLGTVQDGGSPHIGCNRDCCAGLVLNHDPSRMVVALGLVDGRSGKTFLFEATPDIDRQLRALNREAGRTDAFTPDGVFLTHAHMGHYTGLMYLGREALNAREVPVHAMPRMRGFLAENGPWSQLVEARNIRLETLENDISVYIGEALSVTPVQVPHRDEYSETVGYLIRGPRKTALFIPDIDKWERWGTPIEKYLAEVDLAFVDATFYDAAEIGYRDVSLIPHPFVSESRQRWDGLAGALRNKVHFIHLNHTNPLLDPESEASRSTEAAGYHIARTGQKFRL
ncbi:MBL fold metallo-hydrolase [Robiginitalea sp. SC105]|nr:MBL fold metallo-hydrolase [Robiginitalea sp. SC105]